MKANLLACAGGAMALGMLPTAAVAQDDQATMLPEVEASAASAPATYKFGAPIDHGSVEIRKDTIDALAPGSGDVTEVLRLMPTVQFGNNQRGGRALDVQDLRPADISISGGRYFENSFLIDGVDIAGQVDVTRNNPAHYGDPAGASSQSIFLDTNLIGSVTLRDSNVSAEHGRFMGGVLDVKTRDPKSIFGLNLSANCSVDEFGSFVLNDELKERLIAKYGDAIPQAPRYSKYRLGASVDVPVSDRLAMLFAYNRSAALVTSNRVPEYGGGAYGTKSLSENYMGRFRFDATDDVKLTGQLVYSPYRAESAGNNGRNNLVTSRGGGWAGNLELTGGTNIRWSVTGSYSHTDTGRRTPADLFSYPSSTPSGNFCGGNLCVDGGFGDIDQFQQNFGLKGKLEADVGLGVLRGGFDYRNTHAQRERLEAHKQVFSPYSGPREVVCADPNDPYCVAGEFAWQRILTRDVFLASVKMDEAALWAEYELSLGALTLRPGLRYDRDSLLKNNNFAPRLSASYDLPWQGWALTAGANRYYGRSILAYALANQESLPLTMVRTPRIVGDQAIFDPIFPNRTVGSITRYETGVIDSPYVNELTAGLQGRIFGGQMQLRGIWRDSKKQFSKSTSERVAEDNELGGTTSVTQYQLTNHGRSSYRGVSVEWVRNFGRHNIALNANYSKTKSIALDYLEIAETGEDEVVAYNGVITPLVDIIGQNQQGDFASPWLLNASWTARWTDRFETSLLGRYRGGYSRIEDTETNVTIDGGSYDRYELINYSAGVEVDFNTRFTLGNSPMGKAVAEVRIANVLNRVPNKNYAISDLSEPYQMGRTLWIGLSYAY